MTHYEKYKAYYTKMNKRRKRTHNATKRLFLTSGDNGIDYGYLMLRDMIISLAVEDYIIADFKGDQETKNETEQFLRSGWLEMWTGADANEFMKVVQRKSKEYKQIYTK